MCGIVGFAHPDPARPADRAVLERMNAAIHHRGPDEDGFFLRGPVAMAMKRLAIIDLSGGQQPIPNEDGTINVVFNGEIYNFRELRKELEARGHRFRTHCDTEVLVHGYEEWGVKQLCRRLEGMFAFSIWDDRLKKVTLARDRVGKKPLHYHVATDGTLIWGSEIKSLLDHPQVPREVNRTALWHYLTIQGVPEPQSAFQAIQKVPPGHILEWYPVGCHDVNLTRFWQPRYEPKKELSEGEACEKLRAVVRRAVKCRLVSEVPLGAFLSGGIDSSVIVGLMAEMSSTPVKTFTIGFSEEKFSEISHARRISEHFGTEHHEEIVSWNLEETLPAMVEKVDEPLADPAALAQWHLSKMTRRHVTVALSGDGGDETHGGYQRHLLDGLVAPANLISRSPLSAPVARVWEAIFSQIPVRKDLPPERNWALGLQRLGQVLDTAPEASLLRWSSYFSERAKHNIMTRDLREVAGITRTEALFRREWRRAKASTRLDRTLATDLAMYLAPVLLVKADRMTMAHSLEARSPFLDSRHIAFTGRLPVNMKIRGRTQKYLLKKAFAELLPRDILNRPKQGFALPVGEWLRGPLRRYTREMLLSPEARGRGLFREGAVPRLLVEHNDGRADHGKRLWALLVLELWFRRYFDRH